MVKKVLRRPVFPVEFFQELNKQVSNIKMQRVDRIFKQLLLEALDTVSWKKKLNVNNTTYIQNDNSVTKNGLIKLRCFETAVVQSIWLLKKI